MRTNYDFSESFRANCEGLTEAQCYEIYVGSITVQEFICGYDEHDGESINRVLPSLETIGAAVNDLIFNWPHEGNPPAGLEEKLIAYCQSQLAN